MGGGLPTSGQGSKVYVLCAEPKEHKRFRPGNRPGGIGFPAGRIGDRGDREIVYVPNVYVPFPAPSFGARDTSVRGRLVRNLNLRREVGPFAGVLLMYLCGCVSAYYALGLHSAFDSFTPECTADATTMALRLRLR